MKQIFVHRTAPLTQTTNSRYTAPFSDNTSWGSTVRTAKIAASGNLGYLRVERRNTSTGALSTLGVGITETYRIIVNGVNSGSWVGGTVTIGPGESSGLAPALDVPVSVGDLVTISRDVLGGNPSTYIPCISLVFSTTNKNTSQHGGFFAFGGSTVYIAPLIPSTTSATRVDARGSCLVGTWGSLTYHTFELSAAPGDGKSVTFALYKNGTKQDGSGGTVDTRVTISGASDTTGSATFDLAVDPGDELSLEMSESGGVTSLNVSYGTRFVAEALDYMFDDGEIIEAAVDDNLYNVCINHTNPSGTNGSFIAPNSITAGPFEGLGSCGVTGKALSETPDAGSSFWFTCGLLAAKVSTAPGTNDERRWYLRKDGVTVADAEIAIQNANTTGSQNISTATGGMYLVGNVFSVRQFENDLTDLGDPDNNDGTPASITYALLGLMGFTGHAYLPSDGGTVSSITPDHGPLAGGTAVTIAGTDFPTDADTVRVLLRGIECTGVTVNSATEIVATSGASGAAGVGDVEIVFEYDDPNTDDAEAAPLVDGWEYDSGNSWWVFDPTADDAPPIDNPGTGLPADTPTSNGPIYFYGATPPGALGWAAVAAPSTNGWWWSDEGAAGSIYTTDDNDRPKPPRTWDEIDTFATGAAAHLGGSCAVAYRNKMIYAARGYTVGSEDPPLRIFDGHSDRLLTKLPKDSGGDEAEAVMCMIVANGTVYVSTLDTGGNGGRVFELDLDSATLTPIGAAFSGGEVPYAMTWGQGRLWVGTNFGNGAPGRVMFIRPGIDSSYTEDEQFGASLGGVQDLVFYDGKLYAAIDNENGTAGEVRVRGTDGTWAQSVAGPNTTAMNGYTRLLVFNGLLFGAYWADDTPDVSIIRKFDGSSWSTVYTGASGTLQPVIALFEHAGYIYALFGGDGRDPALIRSATGASSSWTDLSTIIFAATDAEATPAIASVRF